MSILSLLSLFSGSLFAKPTMDLSQYSDGTLVIVNSSKKKEDAKKLFSKVEAIKGLQPIRINSGHFKRLMPCWEIIAIPAKTSKEAKNISRTLKKHNVDH